MCKETGWSVEYVLKMPARRFFALRKALYEVKREEKYSGLMDLCDVQFISVAQNGYHQELKDYYRGILDPEWPKKRLNTRHFDMDNDDERQRAANILAATFKQKARLMGLATDG